MCAGDSLLLFFSLGGFEDIRFAVEFDVLFFFFALYYRPGRLDGSLRGMLLHVGVCNHGMGVLQLANHL